MIKIGTSTKNQQQISIGGTQMQKVYVGDKLVWTKSGFFPVKLGLIYNPYVIFDARGLISSGWHIVNVNEINTLRTYSGNAATVATKVKEVGAWGTDTTTNEYKLNLRKSGYRNTAGSFAFYDWHIFVKWNADTWRFGYCAAGGGINNLVTDWISFNTTHGYSVRAIKNSTSLSHGQEGKYTGNDGKVYRTICIGTQEWLADNLAETKFSNGDSIPEIVANGDWAAQTSSALCALGNNWDNL